jgi:mitogen-activated protein kinase 15
MYLQALHGHENIIEILNVIKADNDKDLYLVTDFMESDLHAVIKGGILQEVHKQFIIYQVLRALKYMHAGQLLHRDIKPSNILLNADCSVKLCDFGLSRSVASIVTRGDPNPIMTDYVATRWYRAPEILFGSPNYTLGVDVWAVGCILAEMMIGKPIFPGTSTLDQIERILQITGVPSRSDIESIKSPFVGTMLESINLPDRVRPLMELVPNASEDLIDFLYHCFQFNPSKRSSISCLLSHRYLSQFYDPNSEPGFPHTIRIPLDDNMKLSVNDYRKRLYDLIFGRKKSNKRATESRSPELPSTASTAGRITKRYSPDLEGGISYQYKRKTAHDILPMNEYAQQRPFTTLPTPTVHLNSIPQRPAATEGIFGNFLGYLFQSN